MKHDGVSPILTIICYVVSCRRKISNVIFVKNAGTNFLTWNRREHGQDPEVVLTDASPIPNALSYAQYRAELESPSHSGRPVVVVFGTGWGISDVFYPEVHRILAPVYGPGGAERHSENYNHLSVRSAVAIILDRLFGQ